MRQGREKQKGRVGERGDDWGEFKAKMSDRQKRTWDFAMAKESVCTKHAWQSSKGIWIAIWGALVRYLGTPRLEKFTLTR
jgi:hypothetical protein